MSGVNKVILLGNLGKDPEVKEVNGSKIAKFSLATSETYKDKEGNRIDRTEWHNIVFWRVQAEIAEKYLKKGSQIYLEGKIRTRSYDDKDGNKKYITEIEGENFTMLNKKSEGGQESGSYSNDNSNSSSSQVNEPTVGDDLPF